jgi:hypothetical protein
VAAVVTAATIAGAAGGAERDAKRLFPKNAVTLGKGRLWGKPWRVVAYRTKSGFWCESLLNEDAFRATCSDQQPRPDPLYISAGFTRERPRPTTIAVVAASEEVARVSLKLVPSDEAVSMSPVHLDNHARRIAGLPPGFGYFIVAVQKLRGFRAFSAFDAAGNLLGHYDGYPAPPSMSPPPAMG